MTCQQGTRQPKFIQFSKENGRKLSKGDVLFVMIKFKKKKLFFTTGARGALQSC